MQRTRRPMIPDATKDRCVYRRAGDTALINMINHFVTIQKNERQVDLSRPFMRSLDLQGPEDCGMPVPEWPSAPR